MRKLTGLALVAALVLGIALPVAADHAGPIDGRWITRDVFDGSLMMLTITEPGGDSHFMDAVYTDTRATGACDRPARWIGVSSNATYSDFDDRFFATFLVEDMVCFGSSTLQVVVPFELEIEAAAADGTRVDNQGNVWRHVSG